MRILTLLTKNSVREIIKEKKFLQFFSQKDFNPGDIIEIIDGNKKSPAIILKSVSMNDVKQEIRKGGVIIKKLKLSKTGENSHGKIIEKILIPEVKNILKNPELAQKNESKLIQKFFPKKRKKVAKNIKEKSKSGTEEISNILSFDKIVNREKTYNSEMQETVDEIRNYFNEKTVKGIGSFSYYIGFFKKIPLGEVRQIFGEVRQTKKSTFDKKKLFWWKIGQKIKSQKK